MLEKANPYSGIFRHIPIMSAENVSTKSPLFVSDFEPRQPFSAFSAII